MEQDNARKTSFAAKDLKTVIGSATTVYAARGKNVVTIDLSTDSVTSETVLKSLLGPTGSLRAPAILSGDNFVVGFNRELYEEILCQ